MAPRSHSLRLVHPEPDPLPGPISLDVPSHEVAPGVTLEDGVLQIEHEDGGVTVDFNPDLSEPDDGDDDTDDGFYKNLAKKLDDSRLSEIASQLIDAIDRDNQSRAEWLQTRQQGIKLLGLKLETPRGDIGAMGAPLEGMSTVRHPLLLESTVAFQATAGGELLPATGPVKVRNDTPNKPKAAKPTPAPPPQEIIPFPSIGHNGGPPLETLPEPPLNDTEELATALETDMNHYLTAVATEYYPDTDRMLFYIGFGGDGFKKVYNCPLRQRPVSESVDPEDLIVSNSAVDLKSCGRVTHRIKMRRSVMKRMQILGVYRDVDLGVPPPENPNPVDQAKAEIQGSQPRVQRPEDRDYEVYETYCELELDEFTPRKFKGKGLPLPFRVTLEKDSRQVLSITRNWNRDDEECLPKQFFVQFPFIRGLGFYGLGFIHLVGNTTNALTAAWREILDAGMFANFPGFLYSKALGRQLTNQMRVPPGGGIGLDLGAQQDIRAAVMALPYKEPGPAFTSFLDKVEQGGQRLASNAQINVGEGKQDAPVGTTLALIEQSTKLINSVHKRLHAAQGEEFKLLKERFKEDPESFWRHNKNTTVEWKKEQFIQALDNNDLVPVADPNNPTSLHRIAKAIAIKTLQQGSPQLYDSKAVDERIFRIVGIDPEGLFLPQPAPDKPDARLEAVKQKAQAAQQQQEAMLKDAMIKAQVAAAQLQDKMADRQSREQIERMKIQIEEMKVAESSMIHRTEIDTQQTKAMLDMFTERAKAAQEMQGDRESHVQEMEADLMQLNHDIQRQRAEHAHNMEMEQMRGAHEQRKAQDEHASEMSRRQREHEQKMRHNEELNKAKVEAARALARAKPKPAAKGK